MNQLQIKNVYDSLSVEDKKYAVLVPEISAMDTSILKHPELQAGERQNAHDAKA